MCRPGTPSRTRAFGSPEAYNRSVPSDDTIKQAFYEYGKSLAVNMGEGVDASDDEAIDESWDELCGTSMMYSEILEQVLEQLEPGLGDSFDDLKDKLALPDECARGWRDGIKGA